MPASPSIVAAVTGVARAELTAVGTGNSVPVSRPIHDSPLVDNGKPELLFIDAEFCPFCAAERWPLVQALSRFGTFADLSQIRSAVADGDIASFSFYGSSYTSQYLSFVPVVNADRARRPLQAVTLSQASIWKRYGPEGYPFLDFGGRYLQQRAGYPDTDLSGLDWQQIAGELSNPSTTVAKDIVGEANSLTKLICSMTGSQPVSVCGTVATTEGVGPACAPISPNPPAPGEPRVPPVSGHASTSLTVKDIRVGHGPAVQPGDHVAVKYVGVSCSTGRAFDASYTDGGRTFSFDVGAGQVIQGWEQGIAGMRVGGVRELVIPPDLGYGSTRQGAIRPNETLIFVVTLVRVGAR